MVEHYGLDQVRYFFLREVPFGQDGSYSHEAIVNRTNADLANDLGNLAQRSLSMIAKNCDGRGAAARRADRQPTGRSSTRPVQRSARARKAMAEQAIHLALAAIFAVVAEANRYFAGAGALGAEEDRSGAHGDGAVDDRRNRPARGDPVPALHARLGGEAARPAGGAGGRSATFAHLGDAHALVPGTALPAPQGVFPRYVEQDRRQTDVDARRQPLPSRFSGFRRGARRQWSRAPRRPASAAW